MSEAAPENPVERELDRRISDGIDVTLKWNRLTGIIRLEVNDKKTEQSFSQEVDPADALDAFHHPYAYEPNQQENPQQPVSK
ncbi:MAG TPA: hypothetical protein VH234_00045 [Candidatus Saccharimonadales bacterium]|jgi:hypothetical protein|nr:hypothetical protein [Candidatus Saccharimonadales bacterium]